jgi:hypothetical protein
MGSNPVFRNIVLPPAQRGRHWGFGPVVRRRALEHDACFADVAQAAQQVAVEAAAEECANGGRNTGGKPGRSGSFMMTAASVSEAVSPTYIWRPVSIP